MVSYAVEVASQPRRPIAVVSWETSWAAFPAQWRDHLDEVYAWLRQSGRAGGANVMRYRDGPGPGRVAVQVGVEVSGSFPAAGPAGEPVRVTAAPKTRTASQNGPQGGESCRTGG